MKTFDVAFSMGFSCGGARALRGAGLQYASFPLDWIGSPGVVKSAKMVAEGFPGWLARGDLVLVDVRRGGMNRRVYRNVRTGFGFPHDFSLFQTFDEAYPEVADKYARRIARLEKVLSSARSALVVYIQRPIDPEATEAELVEARRLLSGRYPNVSFDLWYFAADGETGPTVREVAPGIRRIGCEYRVWDHGELSHEVDVTAIAGWLKGQAEVPDVRTESEKVAFAARPRGDRQKLFAQEGNPFRRWLLGVEYKLYRRMEGDLTARGVLPRERPLWFPGEGT